jgi:hypothetical protein
MSALVVSPFLGGAVNVRETAALELERALLRASQVRERFRGCTSAAIKVMEQGYAYAEPAEPVDSVPFGDQVALARLFRLTFAIELSLRDSSSVHIVRARFIEAGTGTATSWIGPVADPVRSKAIDKLAKELAPLVAVRTATALANDAWC